MHATGDRKASNVAISLLGLNVEAGLEFGHRDCLVGYDRSAGIGCMVGCKRTRPLSVVSGEKVTIGLGFATVKRRALWPPGGSRDYSERLRGWS